MEDSTAEFVRNARVQLGDITQAELGEMIGLERRSIVRYEAGGELPRLVLLAIKHLLSENKRKKRRNKRTRVKRAEDRSMQRS